MLNVIHSLYAAAMQPRGEVAILDLVRATIGAEHVVAQGMTGALAARTWNCSRLDADFAADLSLRETPRDYLYLLSRLRVGAPTRISTLIDMEQFQRTAFYNDVLRPRRGGLALNLRMRTAIGDLTLIVCRPVDPSRDFGQAEIAMASTLAPHIAQSLEICARMAPPGGPSGVLDQLDDGVALLDAGGRVVFLNRGAEAMLRGNNGVTARDGRLLLVDALAHDPLADAIEALCHAFRKGLPALPPALLRIERGAPAPPLMAKVCAVPAGDPWLAPRERILVQFHDPQAGQARTGRQLQAIFGLTAREAQIADLICNGATVVEAAHRLGLSVGTVRQYLVRIFDKTGARRQTDLIRILH